MKEKILVFDLWGDLAHFRKPYTTTSPLTHSVPPLTTLAGILGALTGKQKDSYFSLFEKGKYNLAVAIKKPIKKVRIALNLIDTKSAIKMSKIKNRTQIKTEFLKEPSYRIYFNHSDENFYQTVKEHLLTHTSVYTLSLGLSENIANFSYLGEYQLKVKNNSKADFVALDSIIRNELYSQGEIDFSQGEFFSETIAITMKTGREVTEYGEVLFERNGRKIIVKTENYWEVEGLEEKILFI